MFSLETTWPFVCFRKPLKHSTLQGKIKGSAFAAVQSGGWLAVEQLCWKRAGILLDSKLSTSQQHVLTEKKGNSSLCCINRSTASTPREVSISLYSAFTGLHLEYHIRLRDLQYRKNIDKLQWGQQKPHWGNWGLEYNIPWEDAEIVLVSLEKRWIQGNLIAFQYLHSGYQAGGARLLMVVYGRRIRDNGQIKQERFRLNIGENFSPWGQPGMGKGCPERLCSLHPWEIQDQTD